MSNISYVTEEGLQKLKDELDHLMNVERPSISKQMARMRWMSRFISAGVVGQLDRKIYLGGDCNRESTFLPGNLYSYGIVKIGQNRFLIYELKYLYLLMIMGL